SRPAAPVPASRSRAARLDPFVPVNTRPLDTRQNENIPDGFARSSGFNSGGRAALVPGAGRQREQAPRGLTNSSPLAAKLTRVSGMPFITAPGPWLFKSQTTRRSSPQAASQPPSPGQAAELR